MSKEFNQKVVWITGGGTGIGRALALEFAKLGALVAVSGRREEKLLAVVNEIEAMEQRALAVPCDVTRVGDIESAVQEIVKNFGRLDVAIANSGYSVKGSIEELSAADWKRQLDTNVVGLAMTVKYALPELKKTQGRVVLMGSVAGALALPTAGAYSASKFAVRAIGQSLNLELCGTGVSCTTIQPGFVESEIGQVDNQGVFRDEFEDRRPKKLMWTAERAAKDMIRAIAARKSEYTVTGHGKTAVFLSRFAPGVLQFALKREGNRRVEELKENVQAP